MQRGEGRDVDNSLDRRHVDINVADVEKMLVRDVPSHSYPRHKQGQEINQTNNQNTTAMTTTSMQTGHCNDNVNGKMDQARTQPCQQDAHHCTIGQQGFGETLQ